MYIGRSDFGTVSGQTKHMWQAQMDFFANISKLKTQPKNTYKKSFKRIDLLRVNFLILVIWISCNLVMLWGIKTEWKYSYACMWMFGPGGPAFSTAFFIEYIFVWFCLNLHRIHWIHSFWIVKKKLHRVTKMKNNEQYNFPEDL